MSEHPFVGLVAAALLSLVAHGVAYASLGYVPQQGASPPPSRVSFRVKEPAPPPVPEQVAPAEPEVTKPVPQAKPAPVNEPPPTELPRPVDLTGVTLTNDSGNASWSSVVGNGAALAGPIAAIRPSAPAVAAVAPVMAPKPVPARSEASIVKLEDLSERPVPPALASVLRDHYPPEAKARGIGGSASVAAEVGPDGRIRNPAVAGESFPGFGEACRRTLQGSRWSPPRDREGRAVATRIRYTCRFVVER